MFYDPCYCFVLSYKYPQLQCIASDDKYGLYTKSEVSGQIAAKILTGIFYGIYFTSLMQEFN
jgi:hypothetical protein